MSDANVVKLLQPGSFSDPLTEVLRNGARALLAQAVEAEVAEFLAKHIDLRTASGLTSTSTGESAICRPSATSTCGPTAFTCRRVLRTPSNASWSSLGRHRRA